MSKGLSSVKTLTAKEIAKKWNLSLSDVAKKIAVGVKVEKEHTKNTRQAAEIARDHLGERPDYYEKLDKMEKKPIVREEISTGGVRGLGNVTGDPAVGINSYVDSNAMSYEDENGNKFAWIKKLTNGHNVVGFKEFNPTELTKSTPKKLKEGISAGPEREIPLIGDPTGSSRKVMKVDEIKLPPRVKKAVATGMTVANLYTAGDIASRAQQGEGHPLKDVVTAASTLPGTKGWAAYAADKVRQAYDYAKKSKQMKEEKGPCWKGYEMVGMKKKGGRKVPNCVPVEEQGSPANPARYTERPMYERRNDLPSGEVERGIYEFDASSLPMSKNIEDRRTGLSTTGGATPQNLESPTTAAGIKNAPENTTTPVSAGPSGRTFPLDKQGKLDRVELRRQVDSAIDSKTPSQVNEISAELVGKVHIKKYLEKGKAPSPLVARAVKKKWLESKVGKIPKKNKKRIKEDLADKDWDDTTGKKLPEEQTKKDVALMGNQKPDAFGYGAKGTTKTIHEETKMDTKELINEALDNIIENNLVDMKENLLTALQEKTMEKLEERKKIIASEYFGQ